MLNRLREQNWKKDDQVGLKKGKKKLKTRKLEIKKLEIKKLEIKRLEIKKLEMKI